MAPPRQVEAMRQRVPAGLRLNAVLLSRLPWWCSHRPKPPMIFKVDGFGDRPGAPCGGWICHRQVCKLSALSRRGRESVEVFMY